MENEKKSSRFGVRLSAIVVAVLLVVCMAVPAFAYGTTDLVGEWVLSETLDFSYLTNSSRTVTGFWLDAKCNVDGVETTISALFFRLGGKLTARLGSLSASETTLYENGVWVDEDYRYIDIISVSSLDDDPLGYDLFFANATPPPPDLKENVTSGLTIVLDWVGATVSALFSGELAGLLPLVAIPVAITILIVAIVVIKRSIWGA